MSRSLRYAIVALVGVGLGLGIPLTMGGSEVYHKLALIPAGTVVALLAMIVVGWNLNAGRLRLLASGAGVSLGQGRALAVMMATEFAICATPAGSGGPVTYAWLLRRDGLTGASSVALYAADQFVDLVFFIAALLVLTLYWLLTPQDLHLGWQLGMLGVLMATAIVAIVSGLRHYRALFLFSGRLLRRFRVGAEIRRRLARRALEFRQRLRRVRAYPPSTLIALFILCTAHWLIRYSVLYFAVGAVGGALTWSYTFLVQMVALSAGQLTLLPGGSGGTEVAGSIMLAPYLDPAAVASAILLWRFATFYWYLIAGGPVFATLAGHALWRRLQAGEISP